MAKKQVALKKVNAKAEELKIKLANSYLIEFANLKNDLEALNWVKSIPTGLERTLLLLLALNSLKNRI